MSDEILRALAPEDSPRADQRRASFYIQTMDGLAGRGGQLSGSSYLVGGFSAQLWEASSAVTAARKPGSCPSSPARARLVAGGDARSRTMPFEPPRAGVPEHRLAVGAGAGTNGPGGASRRRAPPRFETVQFPGELAGETLSRTLSVHGWNFEARLATTLAEERIEPENKRAQADQLADASCH